MPQPPNHSLGPLLQRLPPELRLMIYKEYLEVEDGFDIRTNDARSHEIIKPGVGGPAKWSHWASKKKRYERLGLLAASLEIRMEVLPTLFEPRT